MGIEEIKMILEKGFKGKQLEILVKAFILYQQEIVKVSDFNELKEIVRELAQAQKNTEYRVEELAQAQKELAQAQKRTEERVEELAQAQKRTEERVEELAQAQKRTEEAVRQLVIGLQNTRSELGGLSKTMSFNFENEAYRLLPSFLKSKYGIEIKEKLIRTEIGGKEINLLGKGSMNGKEVLLLGEAKLRIDNKKKGSRKRYQDILEELDEKEIYVRQEYGDIKIVKVIVTHFAPRAFLESASQRGVIVIQSFEW